MEWNALLISTAPRECDIGIICTAANISDIVYYYYTSSSRVTICSRWKNLSTTTITIISWKSGLRVSVHATGGKEKTAPQKTDIPFPASPRSSGANQPRERKKENTRNSLETSSAVSQKKKPSSSCQERYLDYETNVTQISFLA